jgi:outer membrane protein TolC
MRLRPIQRSTLTTPRCRRTGRVRRALTLCVLVCAVLSLSGALWAADGAPAAEPLRFRTAVDLALQHSGVMGIATVNQWRSQKAYQEVRNHWLPQLTVGSGLGYSYGFPLTLEGSAPAVANFTSQQSLFNLSLKEFLKAAKIDWKATSFDVQDKREEVILDAALSYAQLANLTGKLATLADAQIAAEKAQFITEQRLQEGVDSKLDLTKSQLAAARIRLRIADAQGQADVLREHLAKLTGLAPADVQPDPESMPQLPLISQEDDLAARAVANSPVVKLADQKSEAAAARAKGEHRASLPYADLASQYAYLARFNGYDQYFIKYTSNNLAAGLNIKFPFFNPVQKARAAQADADTIVARKQADLTRNQVSENALKLQRSLRQLQAARDVAKLEWQVSQGDLEGAQARIQTGVGSSRDAQIAQLEVNDKYAAYLDAEFELTRAGLQLLRLTGELENWAIPSP